MSHASPAPSSSRSLWLAFGEVGQLSVPSNTPSRSMSATRLVEWNVTVKRALAGSSEIESSTTPWSIVPSASVAE